MGVIIQELNWRECWCFRTSCINEIWRWRRWRKLIIKNKKNIKRSILKTTMVVHLAIRYALWKPPAYTPVYKTYSLLNSSALLTHTHTTFAQKKNHNYNYFLKFIYTHIGTSINHQFVLYNEFFVVAVVPVVPVIPRRPLKTFKNFKKKKRKLSTYIYWFV